MADDINEKENPQHVDYTKIQVPICDSGPADGSELLEDPIEYCPTCIIDENAPTPCASICSLFRDA